MHCRFLFSLTGFLLLGQLLIAQTRFEMGITAGANYSSLSSDLFTTSSGRVAPAVGFTFVVGFSDRFELNQDVVFTQKGARARAVYFIPEQPPGENTYDYYYNTFETATIAGFMPAHDVPIWLQAGGFMGAHFANLGKDPNDLRIRDYENPNNSMEADALNDAFAGLDFGPAFGFAVGAGQFRATARYYMGIKNLYNNVPFVERGPHIRTHAVRFSLSYFL